MSASKGRRKRTWRFRLNEHEILEVSSPRGATEQQVRRRGRLALIASALLTASVLAGVAGGAVWTDQKDYAPGSVVTIWGDNSDGAGYIAGETVSVAVSGPNGYQSACEAVADERGAWSCQVTLWDSLEAVGEYTYTAAGQVASQSGTFSDAININSFASDCTAPDDSFPSGTTACAKATGLPGGSGGSSGKIEWWAPSAAAATRTTPFSGVSGNFTDSWVPAASPTLCGTWTLKVYSPASTLRDDDTFEVTGCAPPANNVPAVTANDDSFSEGTSKSYSASWTDTGDSGQTHTCTIDFGDGSGAIAGTISPTQPSDSGTCTASHTYADGPNSYTITASVSDGSASDNDTAAATVQNVAPTIALTGAASVDEGSAYTLSLGNVVDPGTDTVIACSIDWGDGTAAQSCLPDIGSTKTHTYADGPNSYTITVDLTDDDGPFASAGTKAITVDNVAPTVAAEFGAAADCRVAATLSIDPDDAGLNDGPWKVDITWGDGTIEPENSRSNLNSFTVTHVYTVAGNYNATVTVEDKDGASGSDTTNSITVNQTYTVDFLPPLDDSNPSTLITNKMKNGRVVPVKATIYDDCAQAYVTDPNTNVTIKVNKVPVSGSGSDAIEEYADAGQSSSGTSQFRWSEDGFWIYNLDSRALGLSLSTGYRVDIYVGTVKATRDEWALLMPVK